MSLLLLTLAVAVVFIFTTGASMPPIVASHFVAGGAANGFMPRDDYLHVMLALSAGLPLLLAVLGSITSRMPAGFINLPNRDYWLAPEREADTLSHLRKLGYRFGIILAVFLCFVHWLVVKANAHNPPVFPESIFFVGMAAFVVWLIVSLGGFVAHFRRIP